MTDTLTLDTEHEGANPQDPARVERTGPAAFTVRPRSEDGDSNYKFAFDVVVENASSEPAELELTLDWMEPPEVGTTYMDNRASVFLGNGEEWKEIGGRLDGASEGQGQRQQREDEQRSHGQASAGRSPP